MVTLAAAAPHPRPALRPTVDPRGWLLGSLRLSGGSQPPSEAPPQGAVLLIPVGQPLTLISTGVPRSTQTSADLVYLPAAEGTLRASGFEGWRLGLDPHRLALLAADLAGHRLSPARFRRHLAGSQALEMRLHPERDLRALLLELLEMGARPAWQQRNQLELLELDLMIQRLVVLLLCGELIHTAQQRPRDSAEHREQVFDDLLAWIRAHLDQPIQMVDLVRQSGYSQRSLRNFFHERFGCGPVQWIRGERLRCARERLLNPQPQDTVGAIAASLGYGHPSQFSRDVLQAFGSRPSALLREGRRSSVPEPLQRHNGPWREAAPRMAAAAGHQGPTATSATERGAARRHG